MQSPLTGSDRIRIQRIGINPEGEGNFHTLTELGIVPGNPGDHVSGIGVTREDNQALRQTKLTLVNVPLTVISVTTGRGVGGVKVFDFPPGFIGRTSCRASLTLSVPVANQALIVTGAAGKLGVGTVPPANADDLGVDATDDDWATAAAYTCTAWVSAVVALPTEAVGVHDGSVTPIDLYVNMVVNAADIVDGTTTTVVINGTIWIDWYNQGGA